MMQLHFTPTHVALSMCNTIPLKKEESTYFRGILVYLFILVIGGSYSLSIHFSYLWILVCLFILVIC